MTEANLKNKQGKWFLQNYENYFKNFLLPHVPLWLEIYHLTYLTLLWSVAVVLCFWSGLSEPLYLMFVPVFVFLQYITDLLDGAVGRNRDTGLVKWGYYTDHFFDFIFLTAIFLGYGLWTGFSIWFLILYAATVGLMVNSFLLVGTGQVMSISFGGLGPTEGRLIFIIFHILIVVVGLPYLKEMVPIVAIILVIALAMVSIKSQRLLWRKDMNNKSKNI